MKISVRVLSLTMLVGLFFIPTSAQAQSGYSSYTELTNKMKALNNANKNITELTSVAKTKGGKDVWLLTIGSEIGRAHV